RHAELVAEREKRMRTDEESTRAEKLVIGETLDDAEMLRRRGYATLRQSHRRLSRNRFACGRTAYARGLDCRDRRPIRPEVILALAPVDLLERPVRVAPSLDRLPRDLAGQRRGRARRFRRLRHLEQFGIGGLRSDGQFAV